MLNYIGRLLTVGLGGGIGHYTYRRLTKFEKTMTVESKVKSNGMGVIDSNAVTDSDSSTGSSTGSSTASSIIEKLFGYHYYIQDTNYIVYSVKKSIWEQKLEDVPLFLVYSRKDDNDLFNKMKENRVYHVEGYGLHYPKLLIIKRITSVKEVDSCVGNVSFQKQEDTTNEMVEEIVEEMMENRTEDDPPVPDRT